jgi:hypothetical protein
MAKGKTVSLGIAAVLALLCVWNHFAYGFQTIEFKDPWAKPGISIDKSNKAGLELTFSVGKYMTEDKSVDGKAAQAIKMAGCVLPIGAGYPDLPVVSNYVAVPNGATPKITVLSYREEKYQNVEIAPGLEIPADLDKEIKPLKKNSEIYSKNEFFPSDFIMHSPVQKMRGVDVFILSFAPFRYNPVTKELVVRRDMKVSITFEGGTGVFGDDLYRHPLFERILQQNIINYSSLPATKYSEIHEQLEISNPAKETGQFEYIIVVPNDASFIAWAETLKAFRKKQGIKTGIFTTAETGNTPDSMEAFIDSAYSKWTTKPLAVLMMSDLGSTAKAYGLTSSKYMLHPSSSYPQYVSDNVFADLTITNAASTWSNGGAPELVFARMPAQTAAQCSIMVKKIINYETAPPSSSTFYNLPLSAAGWQDERWFGMCSEIVRGFLKNKLGKTTQQQYALVDASGPAGGDPWSTTDPSALVAAYGPAGEGYIASTVPSGMDWSSGTATGVVNAVNNGCFIIMHRDHGAYTGWGEPGFTNTNIPSLTNNLYPFVFSMNCQTGAFQNASTTGGVFSEQFHRSRYGALGVMCATEVSYSFVNDALIMGIMDGMWPNFNSTNNWDVPNAGSGQTYERYTEDLRPAFAMASGKWHLMTQTYTDAAIPADYKEFTCHLFHVFGDPFMTFCSQVPDTFKLTYATPILTGSQTFNVNVKNKKDNTNVQGALVGLYMYVPAKGSAKATDICTSKLTDASGNASFTIAPVDGGTLYVTTTKSNFVRNSSTATVVAAAVTMTGFSANCSDDGVVLNWATASELNCEKWEIKRAYQQDAGYEDIGTVKGNGSVNTASSYEFIDKAGLSEGMYYYKLVEVDYSGNVTEYGPVLVEYKGSLKPLEYLLGQSRPNPTTGGVTISYAIKNPGPTSLKIYNALGQVIKTLVDEVKPAGAYVAPWDGCDDRGRKVSNGIYFYKLVSGDFNAVKKITMLR